MKKKGLGFSSPVMMALAMIAGSVGTGNIWRFPRVAAANGGGAFVIAYVIIVLFVVLPLMMGEHAIGRATRHGLPGAFRDFMQSKKATWFGSFVWVTIALVTAYYTVVVAWVTYYFGLAIVGGYNNVEKISLFNSVSNGNVITVVLFVIILGVAAYIAYRGVSAIEKANSVFLPVLFICLIIIAIRTATLPKSYIGFNYLFNFEFSSFLGYKIWLEALTQAVWSAGPGWGICIAYGVYSKQKSDVALTSTVQGLGDISVALLSGIAIIPALFAVAPNVEEAIAICLSGNNGLAFISLTSVFEQMPGGHIMGILFFASLIMAGLSSLVAHFVILSQPFADAKKDKKKSMILIYLLMVVWGLPSAWNIGFFNNQDFVAGMLMIIGAVFSCFAIRKYGTEKARTKLINNEYTGLYMPKWWSFAIKYVTPIMAIVMFVWWCVLSIGWSPDWWNPTGTTIITLALQVGAISILCAILNDKIADSAGEKFFDGENFPPMQDNGYSE